jgi:hypothetical protein
MPKSKSKTVTKKAQAANSKAKPSSKAKGKKKVQKAFPEGFDWVRVGVPERRPCWIETLTQTPPSPYRDAQQHRTKLKVLVTRMAKDLAFGTPSVTLQGPSSTMTMEMLSVIITTRWSRMLS